MTILTTIKLYKMQKWEKNEGLIDWLQQKSQIPIIPLPSPTRDAPRNTYVLKLSTFQHPFRFLTSFTFFSLFFTSLLDFKERVFVLVNFLSFVIYPFDFFYSYFYLLFFFIPNCNGTIRGTNHWIAFALDIVLKIFVLFILMSLELG